MTVPADISQLPKVSEAVENSLAQNGCPAKVITRMLVAVDEIMNNIASYAYTDGGGYVDVDFGVEGENAFIKFTDSGKPYNPLEKADPDISLSADDRLPGGLGILMVKRTMDSIDYARENGKNVLTIRKKMR